MPQSWCVIQSVNGLPIILLDKYDDAETFFDYTLILDTASHEWSPIQYPSQLRQRGNVHCKHDQ